jgi:hypothetical protein
MVVVIIEKGGVAMRRQQLSDVDFPIVLIEEAVQKQQHSIRLIEIAMIVERCRQSYWKQKC